MNKTVFALCAALAAFAAASALADDQAPAESPVIAQTLLSDGSTNTWTQADLIAALQLINRKYHRDCEAPSGRRAWHGKLVVETVSTNGTTLVKTEQHEDGAVFRYEAPYVPPSVAVSNANARLMTTLVKGVPKALAEARLRREQERSSVSNVTVTVTAGGN